MLRTIRSKILIVTLIMLTVFAIKVFYTVHFNQKVVEEMRAITQYQIPIEQYISSIDVLTYELELKVRRGVQAGQLTTNEITDLRQSYDKSSKVVLEDFMKANSKLDAGINDEQNDTKSRVALSEIKGTLKFLQSRIEPFIEVGNQTIQALESGDFKKAKSIIDGYKEFEKMFGNDISDIRKSIENLTLASLNKTEENTKDLLILNILLFFLAAIFGLGIFMVLTSRLHQSLNDLIKATKKIELGNFDVYIHSKSEDEIGELSNSFNQMVDQIVEKDRVKDTFGKYLDPRIVVKLIESQGDNTSVSERRPATVFFSDIKGFSEMSESLTASAMVNLLNQYFSAVTREIRDKHGIIDKFIGDAVMAFWTAPFSVGDRYATDACLSALQQQKAIEIFRGEISNITGLRKNPPNFFVRMGLSTGEVVVGTIGSDITKSYTVIGDVVNTASRLEGINKVYGTQIIIDEATYKFSQGLIEARELDLITVAGKTEPLRIYELVCASGELSCDVNEAFELFANGLKAYRDLNWELAEQFFKDCLQLMPGDGPAQIFLERIQKLKKSSPPTDWGGVWHFSEK